EKNGPLLALRGLVHLDTALARDKGKLAPDTPGVREARADAEAAVRAGEAGEGNFVLGRVAEELGQRREAAASYRKAVAAAPPDSPEAARYGLALARVLLQAEKGAKAGGQEPGVRAAAGRRGPSTRDLLTLALVGLQPPAREEM